MDCEKVGSLLGGPPGSQEMDCEKVGSLLGGPAGSHKMDCTVRREAVC